MNCRSVLLGVLSGAMAITASAGEQPVRLEWRPATQRVVLGDSFSLDLFAVSDRPVTASAARVIFSWNPVAIELLGTLEEDELWQSSGLVENDPWGINEVIPPADGDGVWDAYAQIGQPVSIDVGGVRLTTFEFRATDPGLTQVEVLPQAGSPPADTVVLDAVIPNFNLVGTGQLGDPAVIEIVRCFGDLDGDGETGFSDLVILIGEFGSGSAGDLDGDGNTDFADLVLLIGDYGCSP